MKLVNVTLPKELERKIATTTSQSYTSTGEFVRSAIIKLLSKYKMLPQAAKIDLLRAMVQERMRYRKDEFEVQKELKGLRSLRENRKHARRS